MKKQNAVLEELLKKIRDRRQKLEEAGNVLKAHFVGLDTVIDDIIKNLEVWYIMPELIKRPIIINLWGMTGVGKTDLVRRLVKALNFSDRFVEIQLSNQKADDDIYQTTIQSVLSLSNLEPDAPGILLLDEIQRFRFIDEDGSEIRDTRFQDVWMLLSDGKFSGEIDSRATIFSMFFESLYYKDNPEEDYENVATRRSRNKKRKERKYKQNYYSAKRLKKALKLKESIEDIMTWDLAKKDQVLTEKIQDQSFYDGEDYSKLLIFVSGNLDEAYTMASECEEIDVDADLFHDYSLKINVLTIKKCLKERFKPEQIARLGNVHVIYPSLSKSAYVEIARRKIEEIVNNIRNIYTINIDVDQSIYDFIYRNGVFPTQGTRPLFTTISAFFENSLPFFMLHSIENANPKIRLYFENDHICGCIGKNIYQKKYEGDIDKIKQKKASNEHKIITSVHEAGHAVVYAALFGIVPTQIAARTASDHNNGFVGFHEINMSKENMLNQICILLSGRAAEDLVFGTMMATDGSISDYERATVMTGTMVRTLGMSTFVSKIAPPTVDIPEVQHLNNNSDPTNELIEQMVREQRDRASRKLVEYLGLLHEVSNVLIVKGSMNDDEFKSACLKHGLEVKIMEAKDLVCTGYREKYDTFFQNGEK